MRRISTSNADVRLVRVVAICASVALHLLVCCVIIFLQDNVPVVSHMLGLEWSSSGGGGGGPNLTEYEVEFGPQSGNETTDMKDVEEKFKVHLIHVQPHQEFSDVGTPVVKQEKPQPKQKRQKQPQLYGENLPTRHRRGSGPGAGGGSGGGTGGGIGKSSGYSIDWGGVGSRRLLSGRMPRYPEGTNKEMAVALQFSVLPDGSVSFVTPLRRSDPLLEREAVAALKSWRFDPLPSQYDQKTQVGTITFNFKLE